MPRPKSSLVISNSELGIPLRHQVVFAPAGSGKTERLSRRYIELLETGVKPERILTLTFTEKAAAEMKERIFDRLRAHNPELYRRLLDDVLKLRISTIHSFCLSLVKRFAPLLGLDPRVDVLADSGSLWDNARYDTLMQVAEAERQSDDYRLLIDLVTRDRTQGWSRLSGLFDAFFGKRVAVQRARMLSPDLSPLDALAGSLKASPVGKEKFPDYRRLFPKQYSPDAIAEAARLIEDNATVFMTTGGTPRIRSCSREERAWNEQMVEFSNLVRVANWNVEFGRSFELFRKRFLETYTQAKREAGQVDYDDMEYLALKLFHDEAEWQNILYAFDEHTDHILVDEFQDTSFLQWGIIDKLTEEWRAGEDAKTDRDVSPTIFIVGDDKQSIYMFRDAKVEVFAAAADKLELWLGKDKLERITLEDNYRSLQSLIDFNNALFSRLMSPTSQTGPTGQTESQPWMTRYAPFSRARKNTAPGKVELILDRLDDNVGPRRQREAAIIAKRIKSLVAPPSPQSSPSRGEEAGVPSPSKGEGKGEGGGAVQVYDRNPDPDGPEIARPCEYKDIAILIRSRTHLPVIEDALLEADIPFMVLGGTGFYSEPETRYLTSLLSFLVDPTDDVALYVTLRGPFFDIPERDLFFANLPPPIDNRQSTIANSMFLWDRVKAHAQPGTPLDAARTALDGWLAQVHRVPLSRILEQALTERGAWAKFWEPQREANVRKFISIIEGWETSGDHPLRILRQLEQAGANEPKADVRTEGRNAVQIITVHSAKGLQFPVVFLPGLDDKIRSANSSGDRLVIEEVAEDDVLVSYIPDAGIRKTNEFHQRYVQKEYEEEKRIFYVACTRARDALFLTGIWGVKSLVDTRLTWLVELLGLHEEGDGFALEPELPGTTCITPAQIPETPTPAPLARDGKAKEVPRRVPRPSPLAPRPSIRAVTRHTPSDHATYDHESIGLGEVTHKVLEEISSGALDPRPTSLAPEVARLLRLAGLPDSLSSSVESTVHSLESNVAVWDIIKPHPGSFAELPITYSDGETIFTGRIDRLIVTDTEVRIYDYKTFRIAKKNIPALAKEYYDGQLKYYEAACSRLYPGKKVSTFLIFTALPESVQTGLPNAP
jgi:ATP-dependent helicase/nuclease subunit A